MMIQLWMLIIQRLTTALQTLVVVAAEGDMLGAEECIMEAEEDTVGAEEDMVEAGKKMAADIVTVTMMQKDDETHTEGEDEEDTE